MLPIIMIDFTILTSMSLHADRDACESPSPFTGTNLEGKDKDCFD